MLAKIDTVETVYEAPPGGVGVYRIRVTFANDGFAVFHQALLVSPKVGEMWEMIGPRLELLQNYADGSPR